MNLRPYQESAINNVAQKLASGVYRMYWNNNQYFYYGQSKNFAHRWRMHLVMHSNYRITEVISRFGKPDFEIIEYCGLQELNEREQYYINLHFNNLLCLNLSPTAGSCKGVICRESTKRKIADKKKELTPEQRANIANAQKGKTNSLESNIKRRDAMLSISDEYKQKMRQIKLGTYTGSENHASKLVLNIETGIFYDTLKEATNSQTKYNYGYCKMMVSGKCNNKTSFIYA